jgi:hypothetical protein
MSSIAGLVRLSGSAHIGRMHLQLMDWVVLVAFVVPTAIFACVWAVRDLDDKAHLWPVRSEGRGMAGHWIRDGLIVLLWIAVAVGAAAAFRLFFR